MSSPSILRAISIYCCYSNKDQAAWERLESHLAVLRRSRQIVIHDCSNILSGNDPILERNAYLHTADLVLLILSHNFVADDLCWEMMLQAMQKHQEGETRVIPIRLSPVYYKIAPFAQLSMLPREKPITLWRNPHEAYENVVEGIHEVVKLLRKQWRSESNAQKVDEPVSHIDKPTKRLIIQSFESSRLLDIDEEDLKL